MDNVKAKERLQDIPNEHKGKSVENNTKNKKRAKLETVNQLSTVL